METHNRFPFAPNLGVGMASALLVSLVVQLPASAQEPVPFQPPRFIRGDVNMSGFLSLSDALTVVGYLFLGEPDILDCEEAADANDDGQVDLGDALSLLFHLFAGDPPPPAPFPGCGEDPTPDSLGCASFWICATGTLVNSLQMKLLPVPAGDFEMGSPVTERGRSPDEVLHTVVITCDFYMSENEVTQGQYLDLMGKNPSWFNGTHGGYSYGTLLTRAVETVSWFDATEFARMLSETENRKYRLPYEAEWEYACRAGTKTRFSLGDVLECDDTGGRFCPAASPYMWLLDDGTTGGWGMPVAQKKPNPWGFYDMHGHVSEWCQDWYGRYAAGLEVDPVGPSKGSLRVIRGWGDDPGLKVARSAFRGSNEPQALGGNMGFRVVLELPRCPYGD